MTRKASHPNKVVDEAINKARILSPHNTDFMPFPPPKPRRFEAHEQVKRFIRGKE
jgi:hypothetical protein